MLLLVFEHPWIWLDLIVFRKYIWLCSGNIFDCVQEMAKIESEKFSSMVQVLGTETIKALASGPQDQQVGYSRV